MLDERLAGLPGLPLVCLLGGVIRLLQDPDVAFGVVGPDLLEEGRKPGERLGFASTEAWDRKLLFVGGDDGGASILSSSLLSMATRPVYGRREPRLGVNSGSG
jgi:hypothetical protein